MRFSLTLLLLMFVTTLSAQSKCDRVRVGTFYSKPDVKKNQPLVTVERSEFSQFETIGDNEPIQYSLRWLDECKFVLEKTVDEELLRIVVTITKAKKKYYTYSATSLGLPIVTGKLYRKKP